MRTSLRETKDIEDHLFGINGPGETLAMEARIILNPELRATVKWQSTTYEVIRQYGRQELKSELARVHRQLFTEPQHNRFRQRIIRLFKK